LKTSTTLVLGIGNNLLTDEGVGIHVIELLEKQYPNRKDISFVDGGTLSFTLADYLANHQQLIVVDAARIGGKPGEMACFEGSEMDRYLTGNRQSVHEVGLMDLLDICKLQGHYPEKRALVGIEPESLDWGEQPSASVVPAVGKAADKVMELIRKWNVE
jgi:hydrogenase maturation protease